LDRYAGAEVIEDPLGHRVDFLNHGGDEPVFLDASGFFDGGRRVELAQIID
jgi:hypothetical protein